MINLPPLDFSLLILGVLTFVVGALVTRLMIKVHISDTPVHRSSHTKVTPRGGGMGIIAGFFLAIAYFFSTGHLDHIPSWKLTLVGGATLSIILISLRDDVKGVALRYKLLTQIIIACAVVMGGLSFDTLPLPFFGLVKLGAFGGIFSLLWILFFTNAFNFMDGLDGLAGGSSLIASLFGIAIGFYFKELALLYICFALFFSTLGFYIYNFSPARIFMGDVGSQFLGLLWSILLLLSTQPSHQGLSVYTVPLLFFAFIYDVALTILRRLFKGQSIWYPHRTFLFHILNRTGLSHRRISVVYMGFAFLQGLGALFLQTLQPTHQIFLLIPYLALMVLYTLYVQRRAAHHTRRRP